MSTTTTADRAYREGDVFVREMILSNFSGKTISILKHFAMFSIQEDLFASSVTGFVLLSDRNNLVELFPIVGQETVTITYRTYETFDWVTRTFAVYDIGEKVTGSNGVMTYRLNLVSKEFMMNKSLRLHRSYSSMSPSQIVSSVMKDSIKTSKSVLVEESLGVCNYIPPGLNPFTVIATMTSRAKSKVHPGGAAYMFFENRDGFNFVTLETLFDGTPIQYNANPKNVFKTSTVDDYKRTVAISFRQQSSTIAGLASGAFGVKTQSLDLFNKKLTDVSYDHFDNTQYSKLNRINGVDPTKKMTTENFEYKSSTGMAKFIISNANVDTSSFRDQNIAVRYAQLAGLANGPKVILEVYLNSDLKAGDMVYLTIPTNTQSDVESELESEDEFSSGKYLVTCLRQIINNQSGIKGTTAIELVRDSYSSSHDDLVEKNNEKLGIGN